MRYKIVLAIVCSALVAPVALAAGDVDVSHLIHPGLYEVSAQVTIQGMGAMPSRTTRHCVTHDDVTHFGKNVAKQMKKSSGKARVKDLSLHGKTLDFTLTSPQGHMDFNIVFDDPTHYHETIKGTMAGHTMTMHGKAHRVGDCKDKAATS